METDAQTQLLDDLSKHVGITFEQSKSAYIFLESRKGIIINIINFHCIDYFNFLLARFFHNNTLHSLKIQTLQIQGLLESAVFARRHQWKLHLLLQQRQIV
jgi:hypothetical protein